MRDLSLNHTHHFESLLLESAYGGSMFQRAIDAAIISTVSSSSVITDANAVFNAQWDIFLFPLLLTAVADE